MISNKPKRKQNKLLVTAFCSLLLVLFALVFLNDSASTLEAGSTSPFNVFSVLEHSYSSLLTGAIIGIEGEGDQYVNSQGWNITANSVGNGNDEAYAVGIDGSSNVYVVGDGNNLVSGTSSTDWWIKRYNSSVPENTENPSNLDSNVIKDIPPEERIPPEKNTPVRDALVGMAFSFKEILSQRYGIYGLLFLLLLIILGMIYVFTRKEKINIPRIEKVTYLTPEIKPSTKIETPKQMVENAHPPGFKEVYRQKIKSFQEMMPRREEPEMHQPGFKEVYRQKIKSFRDMIPRREEQKMHSPGFKEVYQMPSSKKIVKDSGVHKTGFKEIYKSTAKREIGLKQNTLQTKNSFATSRRNYLGWIVGIMILLLLGIIIYLFQSQLITAGFTLAQILWEYWPYAFSLILLLIGIITFILVLRKVGSELKLIKQDIISFLISKRKILVIIVMVLGVIITAYLERSSLYAWSAKMTGYILSQGVNLVLLAMIGVIVILTLLIFYQLYKNKQEEKIMNQYHPRPAFEDITFKEAQKLPWNRQLDVINGKLIQNKNLDQELVYAKIKQKMIKTKRDAEKMKLGRELEELEIINTRMNSSSKLTKPITERKGFDKNGLIQEKSLLPELEKNSQKLPSYILKNTTIIKTPEKKIILDKELAQIQEKLQHLNDPAQRKVRIIRNLPQKK